MPVLYQYRDHAGLYVKARIQGAIVTFQLTEAGREALAEAGATPGERFSQGILLTLIQRGEAYTGRSGVSAGAEDPAQLELEFPAEEDLFAHLPKCEESGTAMDLHLVVLEDAAGSQRARILGPDPRLICRKATLLSIPLSVLTLPLLRQLEAHGQVPPGSPAVATLRTWLEQDRQKEWDALRRLKSARQASLDLGNADEGMLF